MGLIGAIRLQVDFRIPWLVGRWPGDGKDWPHSPMGAEKRKDDQELLLFLYIYPSRKRHWGIGKAIHRTREQLGYISI